MRERTLATNEFSLLVCLGVLANFQSLTHENDVERFRETYIVDPRVRQGPTLVSTYFITQQSHNDLCWVLNLVGGKILKPVLQTTSTNHFRYIHVRDSIYPDVCPMHKSIHNIRFGICLRPQITCQKACTKQLIHDPFTKKKLVKATLQAVSSYH